MKTLIITLLLSLVMLGAQAQAIAFTYAPDKNGTGFFVETPQIGKLSLLASYDYGKYSITNTEIEKYGAGFRWRWLIVMYQQSHWQHHNLVFINQNQTEGYKHSFELGGDARLASHLSGGVLYDPLNREARLYLSFHFQKLNH